MGSMMMETVRKDGDDLENCFWNPACKGYAEQ